MSGTEAIATGPPCLDSAAPPLSDLPPVPAEVHSGTRVLGVVIARILDTRVWVQAQDLRLLNLTSSCAAGQYLLLPGTLNARFDPDTLVLNVTVTEIRNQTTDQDAPQGDSPQATGTLLNASAALTAAGNPSGGLPGGQIVGTLSVTTDSRLWNQAAPSARPSLAQATPAGPEPPRSPPLPPETTRPPDPARAGPPQALGFRSSSTVGVALGPASSDSGSPVGRFSVYGAYLYWQVGGLETQFGLIPPEQLGLSALQGSPLLGAALRRAAGADLTDMPLRLESPEAGNYRILYRGVVLKQGALDAGTTLLRDVQYPPVQDVLTLELTDSGGMNVLRRYTVPFDHRPLSRPVGTADYVLAAGYRDAQPGFSASARYTSSADTELLGGLMIGVHRGVQLGLRFTPGTLLALAVDASLVAGPTDGAAGSPGTAAGTDASRPGQGETRQSSLGVSLNRSADWGSLSVRASLQDSRAIDPADREVGRTSSLGLQASLFLNRPALQIEAGIEQLTSGTVPATAPGIVIGAATGSPAAVPGAAPVPTLPVLALPVLALPVLALPVLALPVLALTSTVRAHLGISGSFRLGSPSAPLADWNVRVYAAQTTSGGAGPVGQLGVSVGLNLSAFDRLPGLSVQTGVQDAQPLLVAQQTGQRGDLNLSGAVRLLPTPAVSAQVYGPYDATFDLALGTPPVLVSTLSGTLALTGGLPRLLPSGTRQTVTVNVGVPGVQVSAGGVTATTDASGRASLPLSGVLRRTEVNVLLTSLPLSTSLSVLSLEVQPVPGALITVADFTPYLTRTNLRQLPGFVPAGATAQLTGPGPGFAAQRFTVQQSRYVQFDAQNGDRIAVNWPGGSCTATWSDAEVLDCR